MKHFLKETDFTSSELPELFALVQRLKSTRGRPEAPKPLAALMWPAFPTKMKRLPQAWA